VYASPLLAFVPEISARPLVLATGWLGQSRDHQRSLSLSSYTVPVRVSRSRMLVFVRFRVAQMTGIVMKEALVIHVVVAERKCKAERW
jgi:hypothetical protein